MYHDVAVMSEAAVPPESARERVLDLVRRHGWNATVFQVLGPGFRYFFDEDACVAYVDTGSAWVAAGAPVASTERLAGVAGEFFRAARAAGRRACFFATEDRFVQAVHATAHSLWIGEQAVWCPGQWASTLARTPSLREQLRRARAKGVSVRQVAKHELEAEPAAREIRELTERWLAARAMPAMGFLVQLWTESEERCHFVAEHAGRVAGIAQVLPVPLRGGWFVEHLLRDPHAPNGTVESLFDAVMRWADGRGSSWLTLGLAPLAGDAPLPLRLVRRSFPFLYNFEGLRRFKAKLRPNEWCPIHLTCPRGQGFTRSVLDVLAAFAKDGLIWFGLRTLARGPSVVLALLALLLVPWIFLIMAAPLRFFAGLAEVKWAWVAFDVAVASGLAALLRSPSVRLATLLAFAVTLDAVVTLVEAALTFEHWARSGTDVLVVALGCLAPTFAALMLHGARARIRTLSPKRPLSRP